MLGGSSALYSRMRHVGRLRSPYHASCADACPTGNPTVRLAMASASVSLIFVVQPATKWYAPMSARSTPTASRPWLPLCANCARQPAAITRWMVPVIRRLPLSGNTVGPTKLVTSRSSGRVSPSCGASGSISSLTARTLPSRRSPTRTARPGVHVVCENASGGGPRGAELLVRVPEALGEHARLGHGGHEVRVAVPARQHVHVHVARHAGPRGTPDVGADVDALR